MVECTCDEGDEFDYRYCELHVSCDADCRALVEPFYPEEIRKALDHWRRHGWLGGCSHAQ